MKFPFAGNSFFDFFYFLGIPFLKLLFVRTSFFEIAFRSSIEVVFLEQLFCRFVLKKLLFRGNCFFSKLFFVRRLFFKLLLVCISFFIETPIC